MIYVQNINVKQARSRVSRRESESVGFSEVRNLQPEHSERDEETANVCRSLIISHKNAKKTYERSNINTPCQE